MLIPLGTDRRLKRTPWVNYALIASNVFIFLLTWNQIGLMGAFTPGTPREVMFSQLPALQFLLWPEDPRLFQFLSYQFLHASTMHIVFNMLFLWVFGNAVEDRLGRVGYLFFYLAAGVAAGLGHALVESAPVLGASGSVAGVTGAFLVLFAMSRVTVFYWLIIPGGFTVPSIVVIMLFIVLDLVMWALNMGNTAYMAHLAGYACGVTVAGALVLGRILPRDPADLLTLIDRYRRRSVFKRITRQGYEPWQGRGGVVSSSTAGTGQVSAKQQHVMNRRAAISRSLAQQDVPEAARTYGELLELDPSQVLTQQAQLDVANHLMSEQQYALAATAYELFLKHYPQYAQSEQVELILGLIYARYLEQDERARELLGRAAPRLQGVDRELAQQALRELPG